MAAVPRRAFLLLALLTILPVSAAHARSDDGPAGGSGALRPTRWLVLAPVDDRGRRPFRPDAVFARYLLAPGAEPPAEGQALTGERGEERRWEARDAGEGGGPADGEGEPGWACTEVEVPEAGVWLARLKGASTLFVDGQGFAGDVYGYGFGGVPVALDAGAHVVYVTGIRGRFELTFEAVPGPLVAATWDATLPDLVAGSREVGPVGLEVFDASRRALPELVVRLAGHPLFEDLDLTVPGGVAPLAPRRLAVPLALRPGRVVPAADAGPVEVTLTVACPTRDVATEQTVELRVVTADLARRRTRLSPIDGSVQFEALLPPAPADDGPVPEPALVLSLHGAGVDALRQAQCYSRRPGVWFVAPTNRRPFGFDWQDWGRADAYEALADALALTGVDRSRVSLTGHSMGGHGAWNVAANDPDGFAAVGPSAGWASFDTYGGRPEGALAPLWQAADGPSRTLDLIGNLAPLPVYVLHGTADRVVPVEEAESLVAALREAGGDPVLHEQEGAGHWWDGDAAPGTDCVDWPPLIDLLTDAEIPFSPRAVDVTTMGPGVDSRHHWVAVEQLLDWGGPARVRAHRKDGGTVVTTENVRRLEIWPPPGAEPFAPLPLQLDGQALEMPSVDPVTLVRDGPEGPWEPAGPADPTQKGPSRCGPFKRAFDHRFALVVGTAGSPEESAALLARARLDALTWSYRANGDAPILTDLQFLAADAPDRNVILYGNADTNAAFAAVLPDDCPLVARRGRLTLGATTWEGDDLGAAVVFPRRGSDRALAGVLADSGVRGTRLGATLALFVSGVGYPDFAVWDAGILERGDGGVLAAGWFDHRWRLPEDGGVIER